MARIYIKTNEDVVAPSTSADENAVAGAKATAEAFALKQDKLSDAQMEKVNNALTNPNAFDAAGTATRAVTSHDTDERHVCDGEKAEWNGKQAALVSGTNIKTINGETILGAGNLTVRGLPTHTSAQSGKVLKVDATGAAVWGDAPSGEPSEYIKSAAVDAAAKKLTLTPKTGAAVEVTAESLGAYQKPTGGIQKADLADAVQTSLDKADSALPASCGRMEFNWAEDEGLIYSGWLEVYDGGLWIEGSCINIPFDNIQDLSENKLIDVINAKATASDIAAACPYPATAVTTGATLAAGAISVYTPSATETAATFTLPVPAAGKSADVVMLIDCTAAAPTLTVGLPTGKTATWLDAQDALTYAVGKVYERMYTIIPTATADTYFVTFADKELTTRA